MFKKFVFRTVFGELQLTQISFNFQTSYSNLKIRDVNGSKTVCGFSIIFILKGIMTLLVFFSIWVFFHEHSRFTGQQGKGEAVSLTPLYYLHPLHRQFHISWAIAAEESPLRIASRRTQTRNL